MKHFDVQLPNDAAAAAVMARVEEAGIPTECMGDSGILVRDPAKNAICLTRLA